MSLQRKSKYIGADGYFTKQGVLDGRKLPLIGVKEARQMFDCADQDAHLQHSFDSECCQSPFIAHYSQGDLILLCAKCGTPNLRFQLGYNPYSTDK